MSKYLFDRKKVGFTTVGDTNVLSPGSGEGIYLGSVDIGNSAGAAKALGWGYRMPIAMWKAGQWDESAGPSYIDDTTDAQDAGADDFALTTTTVNDGYAVQSMRPFDVVGMLIGVAEVGSPVYEYTYWNGTAWTAFTPFMVPDYTSESKQYLVFHQPADWAPFVATDAPVATDKMTTGYYGIKCRATTAPTTAPVATNLWVCVLPDFVEEVADGKSIEWEAKSEAGWLVPFGASVVAFCETANALNWIDLEYRFGNP